MKYEFSSGSTDTINVIETFEEKKTNTIKITGFNDNADFESIVKGMSFSKNTTNGQLEITIGDATLNYSLDNYSASSSKLNNSGDFVDILELYSGAGTTEASAKIYLADVYATTIPEGGKFGGSTINTTTHIVTLLPSSD